MALFDYNIPAADVLAAMEEVIKARLSAEGLLVVEKMELRPDIGSDKEFYGFNAIVNVVGRAKIEGGNTDG